MHENSRAGDGLTTSEHSQGLVVLLLLAGCVGATDDSGAGSDFAVVTAGMDTVLIARWTTGAPTTGTVHASFGDEVLSFPESEAVTTHEVLLIGVPAATTATVTLEQGGKELASVDVQTGALPAWVSEMTYTTGTAGFEGVTLVPIVPDGGGGVVAVDGRGRVVWSYPRPTPPPSSSCARAFRWTGGKCCTTPPPTPPTRQGRCTG